jgi:hypothetical protein
VSRELCLASLAKEVAILLRVREGSCSNLGPVTACHDTLWSFPPYLHKNNNIKINFSLERAMKVQRVSRGIALLFL